MSRFTEKMFHNARTATTGMVTGEPHMPVRHTWGEVHERARCIAGGLAAAGVGLGDVVGVLAGFPVEIAPTAQALWMRGASLTMLHQPTPRTDLAVWAEDTMTVIGMIEAKAVIVSEPFLVAIPILEQKGMQVLTVADLLASDPIGPIEVGEDDLALMQLTSGSTGSPKAVQITHRNIYSNAEAMFVGAQYDVDKDVMVSWLPCFHDMGMVGFLTIPMFFGAELVKVTPMDFLRDTLLWAKLIDKYQGTMTAAPNFAYALLAKRLRRQAKPGDFDLSTLRFALSGAEPVEPADVEDLLDAGKPFGLRPSAILPAYGMAETTLAVSFSECNAGLVVDEVDADLLAALRRAVPATKGNTRRLATLGPLLQDLEARIIDEQGDVMPARGVGVIELRGESLTPGYLTMGGFIPAQDEHGWYDTGDLGYLTEEGHVVVCGRVKDVIIMAGRNIYPTDIEGRPAASTAFVRVARWPCVSMPDIRANPLPSRSSRTPSRIPPRFVASSIKWPTRWLPRSTCGLATSWFLDPGPFRRRRRASCVGPTPSPWSPKAAEQTQNPLDTPVARGFCVCSRGSLPGVDAVLCGLHALFDKQLGGIGGLLADRGDLGALGRGKVLQHKRRRVLAAGRAADPDTHPLKVFGTQRGHHRAQPVVAAFAAADLEPDAAELEVKVVVDDDDVGRRHRVELRQRPYLAAGLVHVAARLGQNQGAPG
ncbi:acyl-CoA synthetase (AMP-forming)/AMP-acid ligase II [Mycobacterium tuberculosis]|nr:acyl-CoA synthetase (AMP-forming)/AMP-acid ligase II [Mycobacterium tuberculosis]